MLFNLEDVRKHRGPSELYSNRAEVTSKI